MTTLAIIGAGQHSQAHHGPAIAALRERISRVSICDLRPEAAMAYAGKFGLNACYSNVNEMMNSERPDAVISITPEGVTASMTRQLMKYQVPLLVEKPFGIDAAESEALTKEAAACNARIMVSFNRRFSPVCKRIANLLSTRFADRPPISFRSSMLRHQRFDDDFLSVTAIHAIDMLNSLAGPVLKVSAVSSGINADTRHSTVNINLNYESGAIGSLLIATSCGQVAEQYEVIGPDYRIEADYFRGLTVWDGGEIVDVFELSPYSTLPEKEGAIAELNYFLDNLDSGKPFIPGPQDGLRAAVISSLIIRDISPKTAKNIKTTSKELSYV